MSNAVWSHYKYDDTVRYLGLALRTPGEEESANDNKAEKLRQKNKRYTDSYKVSVLVGSSEIHYLRLNAKEKDKVLKK